MVVRSSSTLGLLLLVVDETTSVSKKHMYLLSKGCKPSNSDASLHSKVKNYNQWTATLFIGVASICKSQTNLKSPHDCLVASTYKNTSTFLHAQQDGNQWTLPFYISGKVVHKFPDMRAREIDIILYKGMRSTKVQKSLWGLDTMGGEHLIQVSHITATY